MKKIILIMLIMFFGGMINKLLKDIGQDYAVTIGFLEGMITCYILQS